MIKAIPEKENLSIEFKSFKILYPLTIGATDMYFMPIITFVGLTALSVLIMINRLTLNQL